MDGSQSSAYADAVVRARQIAAKLGTGEVAAPKRIAEPDFGEPEHKRQALEDPIVAQLKAIAEQKATNGAPGFGSMLTEEYGIPDSLVGMVIGKGGEQITRLQSDSGAKVQIAQDSGGMPTRSCTITGNPENVEMCKQLIQQIIERGKPEPPMGNTFQRPGTGHEVQILVPGQKAGLIIGKGGDTIKRLQAENNVKMVMIQDSNQPSVHDKPLVITGSEADVAMAKEQVMELLASKDMERPGGGMGRGHGDVNAGGPFQFIEVPVPADFVGVVIGKQGDMINKIQAESQAKVQFKKDGMPGAPTRMCEVSGSPQSVQMAQDLIQKVVQDAMQSGRGGRGGGGAPGGGAPGGGAPGGGAPGGGFASGPTDSTFFPVPNEKCGYVIGKGGANVGQIATMSGARVEISKDPPPNPAEKLFKVEGTPDQIRHAIRMICDRAGIPPPPGPPGPGGPPHGPPSWGGPSGPQGFGGAPGWGAPYDPNPAAAGYGAGAADPAWAAYGQQPAAAPAQGYAQPAAQPNPAPQAAAPQPQASVDPVTGQADYTEAWAEYFRQQGMTDYANAIIQQQSQGKSGAAPAAAPVAPHPVAAAAGYQYPGMAGQQPAAAAMPYGQPAGAPGYGQYPQQPTPYGQPGYPGQQ